jgi:phosphate transport system permease protein
MAVIDLTETAAPGDGGAGAAGPPHPPTRPPEEPRIRVRRFDVDEATSIGAAAVGALAATWVVYERLTPASGAIGFWVVWYFVFVAMAWVVSRQRLGSVRARETVARVLICTGGLALVTPLVLVVSYTISKGLGTLRLEFFTQDQRYVGPLSKATEGGGSHAVLGTLEQVGLATLMSVPLGVLTAVFLNEIGGPLARPVRMIVDAMSAIPSIVAGLFIFAAFILLFHQQQTGFAGALALAVLMLPTVTRTTEVVLRLVPGGLREASLALGGTEWRTTRLVVVPTSKTGVVTAVILGIARVIGETAPLLLTIGGASAWNADPFHGKQSALPLFVYNLFRLPQEAEIQRSWTGALVLLLMVLVLFVAARLVGGRGPGHIGRLRRLILARKGLA